MSTEKQGIEHEALEKLPERDNEDIDSDAVIQIGEGGEGEGGGVNSGVGGGSDNLVSDDDLHEYKKTLRLTSDEWKKLNLQYGTNRITFTVTTRYQVRLFNCLFIFDYLINPLSTIIGHQ